MEIPMSASSVAVLPLQRHLGVFSYMVFGGSHHGRQVFCRAYRPEWYEERRASTTDFSHYDRTSFDKNVLDEVGIVHDGRNAVPFDVVSAVWSDLQKARALRPEIFVDSITTGFNNEVIGWVRANVSTMPLPVVREIPLEDLPQEDFAGITAASLATRHLSAAGL